MHGLSITGKTVYGKNSYGEVLLHTKFNYQIIKMKEEDNILKFKGKWNVVINKDFLSYRPKVLGDRAKMLFLVLKSFINPNSDVAFPSTPYLCSFIGWNKDLVTKNLKILKELKLITVEKTRNEKGRFFRNVYTLEDELDWVKRKMKEDKDNEFIQVM